MKLLWVTLLSAFMFASCAPQQARMDMIFSDKEAVPMVEEFVVEVAVLPNDMLSLDLSGWGKPETRLSPQDRLMRDIDQLIEIERRECAAEQSSAREARLLKLKEGLSAGIAYSDAVKRLVDLVLEMLRNGEEGACQRGMLGLQTEDPQKVEKAIVDYYSGYFVQVQGSGGDVERRDLADDSLAVSRLIEELCDKIEQEAWRPAFKSLLQGFVRKSMVLQPSDHSADQGEIFHEGSQLTGYCQPFWDEFSGKFTHDVRFEATLLPLRRFAGVIDVLQDNYTMAGMGSRAYVTLADSTDLSAPLPALIVQWQGGLKPGFVKVVGSGVITQIFGSQGQMEILESTKEIVAGDMFFVLQVRGRLVEDRGMEASYSPGMWRGIPAVTVRPASE